MTATTYDGWLFVLVVFVSVVLAQSDPRPPLRPPVEPPYASWTSRDLAVYHVDEARAAALRVHLLLEGLHEDRGSARHPGDGSSPAPADSDRGTGGGPDGDGGDASDTGGRPADGPGTDRPARSVAP